MRFKCKEKPPFVLTFPKVGDERKIRKFLLFPCRIRNQIVWLETVTVNQKYIKYDTMIPEFGIVENMKWETFSYELIEETIPPIPPKRLH